MTPYPESVTTLIQSEDYGDRLKGINQLRGLDPAVAWPLIAPLATDSNTRVRYAAISQFDPLGRQDLPAALTILRDRLFNDTEADVQGAAADAIGGLGLKEAYGDLAAMYDRTNEWLLQVSIVAALGELGEPQAFELLKKAVQSDVDLVVATAISALGELKNPEGVDLIAPFVQNPDWQIRHRTAQALGRLPNPAAIALLQTLAQDDLELVASEAKLALESQNAAS